MYTHGSLTLTSVPKNYWVAPIVFETWDTHVYDRYIPIKPGMIVIDAGASIGIFSLYASQKVGPTGKVIAFEPEPTSFNALAENVAKASNVIPVNMGLHNKSGTEKLSIQHDLYCCSLFTESNNTTDVKVERLDTFLANLGITHVDFVKIDTEGAAQVIIEGAENLLPNIDNFVMELHTNIPEESAQKIEQLLQKQGFRTKITHHYGFIPYLYATRDDSIEFPTIEGWQIAAASGIGLFLLYIATRKRKKK